MKIYIGNLSSEVTEDDLRKASEEFGKVDSVTIVKDKNSGQSRGFGFVEMASKNDGRLAIESLNGKEFHGQELVVNKARPPDGNRTGKRAGGGSKGRFGGNRDGVAGSRGIGERGGFGGGRGGFVGVRRGEGGGRPGQARGR